MKRKMMVIAVLSQRVFSAAVASCLLIFPTSPWLPEFPKSNLLRLRQLFLREHSSCPGAGKELAVETARDVARSKRGTTSPVFH